MFSKFRSLHAVALTFVSLFFFLAGCVPSPPTQSSQINTPTIGLTPYLSPTPSPVVHIKTPLIIPPTNPPTLTPTPITYIVVKGDTMLAIALRNGISLEELQSANPDVNPRLLSVGTALVIPLGENRPSDPATPTPVPINFQNPNCYTNTDGILCLLMVTNNYSRSLENLSARIILYDLDGEAIVEGVAIAPLNLLPVGKSIPLVIFFAGYRSIEFTPIADIITAQRVPKNDDRYLNVWDEVDQVEISSDGSQAEVIGMVGLPKKSLPAKRIWIVAIAYSEKGEVVGVRKLEDEAPLESGQSRSFRINVFSLGQPIDKVEVLTEARP